MRDHNTLPPPFNTPSALAKLAELKAERQWDWITVARRCDAASRRLVEAANRGSEIRNPVGFGLRLVATMPYAEVEEVMEAAPPRAKASDEDRAASKREAEDRRIRAAQATRSAERAAARQEGGPRPLATDPRRHNHGVGMYSATSVRASRARILGEADADIPQGPYRKRIRFNEGD